MAVLIAASSGMAMFSAGNSASGATYSFSTGGGDWQTSTNWTPNGPPGAGDVALFPKGITVNPTLTAGTVSVGAIIDNLSGSLLTLSNADLVNPSQLTLTGTTPSQPLIQLNAASATSFTIAGYNGSNTGSFSLVLGASGQIQTAVNGTLTIAANMSETGGSQGFTKTGFGTLALSGSNSFTGATDVHRGNLLLDFTSNTGPKLSSTGSLIFEGSSLFVAGNSSQAVSQTVDDTYINAAQNTISVTSNGQNVTLNAGNFHHSVGAYANINYTQNGGGIPDVVTSTGNTHGIIGGWLTVGNNDWAANDGSGDIVPLNLAGGYSTNDNVSTWAADANITNDSSNYTGTQTNDLSIASLRFNDNSTASTVTMASGKTLTLDTGGILLAGSTTVTNTITGGNLTSGVDEIIATTGSNKTLKINSIIADRSGSGAGLAVTKSGSGTIQLFGANTYTGNVYINTGTLVANTIAATGSPSSLGENGTIYLGSPDTVSTPARLIYSGGNTSTDRPWVIGEGGGAFNISGNPVTLTLTGPISGTGSITINNNITSGVASTLAIQGANTFTGMTYLSSGALSVDTLAPIGQNSSIGTGTGGGTIVLGDGNAGTLTYTGTVDANTNRLLQLDSINNGGSINLIETNPGAKLTWNGTMQFASGQPINQNGSSITFSTGPNNVRPFQLNAAGTIVFAGNIGNGTLSWGQLQKTGAGTVILTGTNNYQLGTVVNSGTLITATNFSTGTITTVGTTQVIGLNVSNGYAQVQAKANNNDPAGFTRIPSLGLGSTGQLDLTNNAMVVAGQITFSVGNAIRTLLSNGYNGGAWNGMTSIISSSAAATASSSTKTALGYAYGGELAGGMFNGQAINSQDVVVGYVLQGDANMDGTVNALDFNAVATNYGSPLRDWTQGDFDYSGSVDSSDFDLFAANFGKTLPGSAALPDAALGAVVPEPASAMLIGLLGGIITLRRRSR